MTYLSEALTAESEELKTRKAEFTGWIESIKPKTGEVDDVRRFVSSNFDETVGDEKYKDILLNGVYRFDQASFVLFNGFVGKEIRELNEKEEATQQDYLDAFLEAYKDTVQETTGDSISELQEILTTDEQRTRLKELCLEPFEGNKVPNLAYYVEYRTYLITAVAPEVADVSLWPNYDQFLESKKKIEILDGYCEHPEKAPSEDEVPADPPAPAEEPTEGVEQQQEGTDQPPTEQPPTEELDPEGDDTGTDAAQDEVAEESPELKVPLTEIEAFLTKPPYNKILKLDKVSASIIYAHRSLSLDLTTITSLEGIATWVKDEDNKAADRIVESGNIGEVFAEFSHLMDVGGWMAAVGFAIKFLMGGGLTNLLSGITGKAKEKLPKLFSSIPDLFQQNFKMPTEIIDGVLKIPLSSLSAFAAEAFGSKDYSQLEGYIPDADFEFLRSFQDQHTEQFDALMQQIFDQGSKSGNLTKSPDDYLASADEGATLEDFLNSSLKKDKGQISWTVT